jgi:AbrB family looped-hinge helix DNA binding protein
MTTTVTIDEQGRVELPEELRQRLPLEPGRALHLQEREDGILISPIHTASIRQVEGLWVLDSELSA